MNMSNFPSLWRSERYDPLRSLQREMERFFDTDNFPTQTSFTPACDLEETATHYLVSMDLPGLTKNDVKIEIDEDRLRVYGERKEERKSEKKAPYRSERYYGSFERIMTMPRMAKADQAEAHFENGVLQIAIPKAEAAKTKQIPVSEAKSGIFSKVIGAKEKVA